MLNKRTKAHGLVKELRNFSADPNLLNGYLQSIGSAELKQKVKLDTLISRPFVSLVDLLQFNEVAALTQTITGDQRPRDH